ncbi:MAG TPA: hypothetical protein VJH95_02525 [Candidatus Nanoarchaeia archaeon]|nr:hypothetical protein [Candidatus Nanoarchaeia archaeon]
MEDVSVLKQLILQKLVGGNMWGGKHTPLDFVRKGVPEHYRNTHKGQKALARALKELITKEWVTLEIKRTGKSSGEHLSLNPRKVHEIKQFLNNLD